MTTGAIWEAALGLAALSFATSVVLSRLVLRYAVSRAVLDHPNERSSHTEPTPRGGGLAIVVVVLLGLLVLWAGGVMPTNLTTAIVGGGTLVALVGWLDDRRGLAASTRLTAHLVAAVWLVGWLGGMPQLAVGTARLYLAASGAVLAVVGTVWAINFYNFMDGIDGLATGEAVFIGLAGAALLGGAHAPLAAASLLTASAAAGFLPLNWPRARIFLGDVGSGFLGFIFAGLALASENGGAVPALAWLILLGAFFWDATVTLLRRVLRGERWYASHRSHAYQRAVQAGWSHGRVTLAVLVLDVLLAGLAWRGVSEPRHIPAALAGAGLILGLIGWWVERQRPMSRPAEHPLRG